MNKMHEIPKMVLISLLIANGAFYAADFVYVAGIDEFQTMSEMTEMVSAQSIFDTLDNIIHVDTLSYGVTYHSIDIGS